MLETLKALRAKAVIGFVGGSDLVKISEQLAPGGEPGTRLTLGPIFNPSSHIADTVVNDFDFGFAENGLTAYKLGKQLASQSFIKFIGEDKYKVLVNFILHYVADIDIPVKR